MSVLISENEIWKVFVLNSHLQRDCFYFQSQILKSVRKGAPPSCKDVLGVWGSPQQAFVKNREGTSQDRVCIYAGCLATFSNQSLRCGEQFCILYIQTPCLPLLSIPVLTMKIKTEKVYRNPSRRRFIARYLQ